MYAQRAHIIKTFTIIIIIIIIIIIKIVGGFVFLVAIFDQCH